jgi:hypothetical protein
MIEVFKIRVSKDKLAAMPADERALFILLGYAANQLNLLSKLTLFSLNNLTEKEPEATIVAGQSQMLLRMTTGIIHEIWTKIIQARVLRSPTARQYVGKLDWGGDEALKKLNKIFGGSNIISTIRNNYAFHHPYDADIDAAFQRASSNDQFNEQWVWYFSHSNFNSFYVANDLIMMTGIMNAIGETDILVGQQRLMNDVTPAMNELATLIMALTAAIWRKHFGDELEAEVSAKITDAPGIFEFVLPFFADVPEKPPT